VGLATRYYFLSEGCCLKFAVLLLWGTLSDEKTGLPFAVQSRKTCNFTLLSHLRLPQPGRPGSRISIPQGNRVAQLYPRALGYVRVDARVDKRMAEKWLLVKTRL
jgi:hypothetical protein